MAGFLKEFFKPRSPAGSGDNNRSAEPHSDSEPSIERKQTDPEAVRNATSMEELEHLAVHASTAALRREAVARIDDAEALSRVVKALKGRDKGAFQTARQKLRNISEVQEQARQRKAQCERLLAEAEDLAETRDTKLYEARVDALERQWHSVREEAASEQHARFDNAIARCLGRAHEMAAEQANESELRRHQDELRATVDTLEATLTQLRAGYPEEGASLASLDALTKTQVTRWEEATARVTPDPELADNYRQRIEQLRDYQRALSNWQQHETEVRQALDSDDPAQLKERLKTIEWPSAFPGPPELVRALEAARRRDDANARQRKTDETAPREEAETELLHALEHLEQALEQQQLKPSRQHFRKAQKLQDQLPSRVVRRHQARITRLGRQVQELRDWLGFAARPKLEALCEQMEHLAEQPMEPESKAEHIRELQHNWYDLGGTPDQALWQRFKEAADRAYEPCHEYFSEKNRLKSANLAKREHIVEQLQEFVDNLDWSSCDHKAVDRIQRTARREWSDAKPVDFRPNRPLQKRFDHLIKSINAQLDRERQRNEALKRDIVARAQSLIDHEPLREATQSAKALQKEWESIGITAHSEDRRLWRAFRAACDRIFERLNQEREAEQQSRAEAAEEAEALIRQLDALDPKAASDAEIRRFQEAFSELSLPGNRANAIHDRFQKAVTRLRNQRLETRRNERFEQWLAAIDNHRADQPVPPESFHQSPLSLEAATNESAIADQARALCIRIEIATGAATPPEDQAQRMALQVNRLNEGIRGEQTLESQWDEIESLLATWCQLDAAEGIEDRHYDRLREALKHWFHQSAQQ